MYLNDRGVRSSAGRLILPLSGYPGANASQHSSQRSHLSHAAALLVAVLVEGEQAFGSHEGLHLAGVREQVLDVNAVMLLHGVEELVGLSVQPPCVEAENPVRSAR